MLLSFFNRFIREREFEGWWLSRVGTPQMREEHPFTWDYWEDTDTVHFVDRRVVAPGVVEEEDRTFRVADDLAELLEGEVERALSEVRAAVAAYPPEALSILRTYEAEVLALEALIQRDNLLARYPEWQKALDRVRQGIHELVPSRGEEMPVQHDVPTQAEDERELHAPRKGWIVSTYYSLLQAGNVRGKTKIYKEVKALYEKAYPGLKGPSSKTIMRYVNEDIVKRAAGK